VSTSGSHAFTLDIADIVEEAYERCGSELRSGYNYRTARRSLDLLLLEWQNKGLNLWTVKEASLPLISGTSAYVLSGEKLDIVEGMLRTNAGDPAQQTDLTMDRISISSYAQQTNKLATGRPIKFWVERTPDGIALNLWPTPDATAPYVFQYYYMKLIEDTGKPGSNTIDIPTRHLPALTAGLAYYLSMKIPGAMDRASGLKVVYDEQWDLAADSARDKSSFYVTPGGCY